MPDTRVLVRSVIPGLGARIESLVRARNLAERVRLVAADVDPDVVVVDPHLVPSLSGLASVRWVQSTWAGAEKLKLPASAGFRPDLVITRLGRGLGIQMAEFVLGYILQHNLLFREMLEDQAKKEFNTREFVRRKTSLSELTLGVLGAGSIGCDVARAAQVFGMKSIGLVSGRKGRSVDPKTAAAFAPHGVTADIATVLRTADIIVNCLPSTPETRGLLTAELLIDNRGSGGGGAAAAVGSGTGRSENGDVQDANGVPPIPIPIRMFINVGRGNIVTEAEILRILDQGLVEHMVLDVFEVEPLPQESALWKHPRVTVTPHMSAASTPSLVAEVFVDNLTKFLQWQDAGASQQTGSALAQRLDYVVDISRGY